MEQTEQLFKDGLTEGLVQSLLDAIKRYVDSLAEREECACRVDMENIYHLVALLKAILRDRYGIETVSDRDFIVINHEKTEKIASGFCRARFFL